MTATQNNNTFSMRSTRDAIGFRERINTPVICKLLSSPTPRSKKQHRLRMNLRFGDIPIIEVCPTSLKTKRIAQLASDSKAESCEIAAALSDRICYSNFYDSASSLSCVTLPPLSSAANSSKNSFSLSSHRVRSIVTVTLTALMLLTSQLSSSSAARSSLAKVPLTRTDATSSERGYRTFIGQGSSSSPASRSSNAVQEPLDFQTMKVIKQWEGTTDILLISGRNYVYMIDASSPPTDLPIRYMGKLHWSSSYESQTHCQQMGKQQHECNNFIRVVEKEEDGRLFVCGTNSYEPVCRYYRKSDFFSPSSPSDIPCNRRCGCPHNPYTASASLYTNTSNGFQLFSAVIHDFLSKRPVLMRTDSPYVYSMDKWFNDPTFIKLVESKDGKVYLFFRETATAVETGTSSPTTYSRVAQVCKNDTGGTPTVLRFQWTSFLKARLKCAIPGSSGGQEFVFNNLTSVSDVTQMRGEDGQLMDVIFATFTTPWDWNAVEMSAVCVYSMRTIQNLFEVGNFLGEQELQSIPVNKELDPRSPIERIVKAVPVPDYKVPVPRPGKCSAQSEPINDKTLYFTKAHYLMYDPVQPLYEEPMFVSESDIRATQITVDTNAGYNDVLVVYVGTEDGRILRLRPRLQKQGQKSVLLEEIRVAEEKKCESGNNPCGVLALHVSRPSIRPLKVPKPSTFVAFTDRLVQVAFSNCQRYINSECCNVDPDCGWKIDKCVPRTALNTASLPRVGDLATVPTQCQTDPPLSEKPDGLDAAGMPVMVVIAALAFICGVLVTSFVVYCIRKYRRHHRSHSITKPKEGRYISTERLDDPITHISELSRKVNTSYLDIRSGSGDTSPLNRPSSWGQNIVVGEDRSAYAPLTPSSVDDKEFISSKEVRSEFNTKNQKSDVELLLLDGVQETSLSDEVMIRLPANRAETERDGVRLFHSESKEKKNPDLFHRSDDEFPPPPPTPPPPKLPVKKSSLYASSSLSTAGKDIPSFPTSQNNNNNSASDIWSESLNDDVPPTIYQGGAREVIVPLKPKPTTSSPPLPIKLPSPKTKVGLKKSDTFSAPHGQRIKPPVPMKSNAVIRSASLRLSPPVRHPNINTFKHQQSVGEGSSFRNVDGDKAPITPNQSMLGRRGRTPSFKHNSAYRVKPKDPVAVEPPVVPSMT